jgi:hypothetical protein
MQKNISSEASDSYGDTSKSQVEYAAEQEKSNMENAKKEALEMLKNLVKKERGTETQNDKAQDVLQPSDDEPSKGDNSR